MCGSRSLVLDNEPSPAVAAIVRRHAEKTGNAVRYREVPRPGIAAVRNAALEAASEFDCLVFIDDDETAPPGWPAGLIDVARAFDADVVAGPVEQAFEGPVSPWIVRGGCFGVDSPTLPAGADLPWCATSNTLVMTRTIGRVPGGFDHRYGRTGGSDSLYFAQQRRSGAKIVWAPHAPVVAHVSVERARLGWLLRRAYRNGTVRARLERDVRGAGPHRLRRAIKGTAALVEGVGGSPWGCASRPRRCCLRVAACRRWTGDVDRVAWPVLRRVPAAAGLT